MHPTGNLPPRLLSKADAAAYCSLSQARFDKWRKEGRMPAPLPGTARWDRIEIDAAIDDLRRLGKLTAPRMAIEPVAEVDPLAAYLAKKGKASCKA